MFFAQTHKSSKIDLSEARSFPEVLSASDSGELI